MPTEPDDRALLERHLARASNKALAIGGLCASGLGFVGTLGIVVFVLATGKVEFLGPALFAAVAGLFSLAVWAAARAGRLYGPLRFVVMVPFTSLPTVIFVASEFLYPAGAATFLTGPFSYLYLFVLTVTGFLFSPKLTLTCTALASAQYLAIQLWARPVFLAIPVPDPTMYADLTEPFIYANKAMMVVATGAAVAGIAWVGRRLLERVLREERQNERVTRLFGEYVSPEVRERVLREKGELRGERREVTILFSDLRGFSTFSEGRDPAEVVARLNAYFERMVEAIQSEGGVVDKFVGDAVMAVFGGLQPLENPCEAGVRAAARMREGLASLNAEWAAQGLASFENGIGLHHGPVIQGPLGAAKRKEFTVIGDAVNTAARLEAATKDLGGPVVVSQAVYDLLGATAREAFSPGAELMVKGKAERLTVYVRREA